MWPILLKIGPFSLHTYGVFVAAGFFACYAWTVRLGRTQNIPQETILDFVWILMLSGLLGARLLYVVFNWAYYIHAPAEILKLWQGGLVFYGGLIAAGVAGVIWVRRRNLSPKLMADLIAPGLALGHAFGRIGCFAAGCCYGRECSLPWAVMFRNPQTLAPQGVLLHPSQLYEAGLNVLLFLSLNYAAGRKNALGTGRIAGLYVLLYSLIRLTVEFTRGDDRGPIFLSLTATQWVAILTLLAASIWIHRTFKKPAHA